MAGWPIFLCAGLYIATNVRKNLFSLPRSNDTPRMQMSVVAFAIFLGAITGCAPIRTFTPDVGNASPYMDCHTDKDCTDGRECRSKPGGGTECRRALVTPNDMDCHTDKDCTDGRECRSKPGGGTECRRPFVTPNDDDKQVENTVSSPALAQTLGGASGLAIGLKKEGGILVVPVLINSAITLEFVIDSGASSVSIPADVVLTLIRTGTLRDTDFLGEQTYVLADGTKVPSDTFRIRSLKVGSRTLENVVGSIAPVQGSLLLGQSFLSRFKSWSIDNKRQVLLLD